MPLAGGFADDVLVMTISIGELDALPVVSDIAAAAANEAPIAAAPTATLGALIAALVDEADALTDNEGDADAIVVASAFGLQFSLSRVTVAPAAGSGSDSGSDSDGGAGSGRAA